LLRLFNPNIIAKIMYIKEFVILQYNIYCIVFNLCDKSLDMLNKNGTKWYLLFFLFFQTKIEGKNLNLYLHQTKTPSVNFYTSYIDTK